jgi:hypothetical protein
MGLMSIPQQHLGDRAYNVGNFFDYGNDYQRAFVDPDSAAQECFVYENQLHPPSLLHNNISFGPGQHLPEGFIAGGRHNYTFTPFAQIQNTAGQGRLIITPPGHHYEEFMRPVSTSNYFNKSSSSQKYSFSNNTINRLLNPTSGDKHHFNAAQQTPYRTPGNTTDFNKQAGGLVTPEPHINKILGKKPPVLVQQRVTPHQ